MYVKNNDIQLVKGSFVAYAAFFLSAAHTCVRCTRLDGSFFLRTYSGAAESIILYKE
jgi:hypothetical protein